MADKFQSIKGKLLSSVDHQNNERARVAFYCFIFSVGAVILASDLLKYLLNKT